MVMVLIVLAALVLGVVLGRIWEMRKELRQNQAGFSVPSAHLWRP
jgi:hypothetical protein